MSMSSQREIANLPHLKTTALLRQTLYWTDATIPIAILSGETTREEILGRMLHDNLQMILIEISTELLSLTLPHVLSSR